MNLQNYIEQIKGWVGRQYFLVRHYRIAIFVFFLLALAMIVAGIIYPHEEEHININSAQLEDSADNQRMVDTKEQSQRKSNKNRNHNGKSSKEGVDIKAVHDEKDDFIVKGHLLYDVSGVERSHPWREVFKDISSTDVLSQNNETKDVDNDLANEFDIISNDGISLSNSKEIRNKRTTQRQMGNKNKTIKTDRKSKGLNGNMLPEQPLELVGIIEGNQKVAILRRGLEEQMVTIGSSWQGISVSAITENSVEIVEGGSSRWLKIE
ncbi:hypothetical protein [Veillonella sp. Ser01]